MIGVPCKKWEKFDRSCGKAITVLCIFQIRYQLK
jgi:hypothetical protein